MDLPISDTGKVAALRERGYSAKEIAAELKMSRGQVASICRRLDSKANDSRRIFETYEMVLEVLGIVREMASASQLRKGQGKLRSLEKRVRIQMTADALDRSAGVTAPGPSSDVLPGTP